MKRPIEPSEILPGDLIRNERVGADADVYTAVEYVADHDGDRSAAGTYYLLDRPAPPVQLPEKPTLGWLGWNHADESGEALGHWYRLNSRTMHDQSPGGYSIEFVTAFTPATAVPTDALDKLRASLTANAERFTRSSGLGRQIVRLELLEDVRTFLAAVDTAGDQS